MSGHSKWANIRVRKTAQDAKRGKVYTRHARLIQIAAKGGGDPAMNPTLRTAIENAKIDGVPNANIDRAVKKGTGEIKGEQMEVAHYAAYGPGNVALVIECLTDNKNRTVANIRSAIERHGGRWAESGSVLWMFEQKGIVVGKKNIVADKDSLEMKLIDAGADDIEWSDDTTIDVSALHWPKIRDLLKADGFEIVDAGLKFVAKQKTSVPDAATAKRLMEMIELIEEDDDVSEVHTNADISDEVANQLNA
ncbi:MAG: YebC/PmpR family DNA-binding transcriptional regulator [Candidatus Peribacteraceae bacterium]|nr:YebC/PmpR family DNA-binding transcriptional regulator [Candidatus Peribacteraceae bacterium]MDD5075307.1 YebC/PmpR family DNA-binding transcriptional regulator [Candidatus Peribacteraceae bacterium]